MKPNFYWNDFKEEDFLAIKERFLKVNEPGKFSGTHHTWEKGCIRAGELCFDVCIRSDIENHSILTFDMYVGGVDTGYGYKEDGVHGFPYDHADIGDFDENWINMDYSEFVSSAEEVMTEFIERTDKWYKEASLAEKASAALHIW
ncbi:MAG: hypothetical protein LIP12_10020 [Clostridiales bacterium]|nr:hypothetical protein [Clostridiales bacterium]